MRHYRHARMSLVGLLALTAAFALAALFAKYKLESLRGAITQMAELRTGARLDAEAVSVTGLRGFKISNFDAEVDTEQGPTLHVHVPELVIYLDLIRLFSGDMVVERVQVDDASIRINLSEWRAWLATKRDNKRDGAALVRRAPGRVLGSRCAFHIEEIVPGKTLSISGIELDFAKVPGGDTLAASVAGHLGDSQEKRIEADLEHASNGAFELEVSGTGLTTHDLATYLPDTGGLLASGTFHPRIRLDGSPGKQLELSIEALFEDLRPNPRLLPSPPNASGDMAQRTGPTKTSQVDSEEATPVKQAIQGILGASLTDPVRGTVTGLVSVQSEERQATLKMLTLESNLLTAEARGTVAYAQQPARLDLHIEATRLPLEQTARHALAEYVTRPERFGFALEGDHQLQLRLTGTTAEPAVAAHLSIGPGEITFSATDERVPDAAVQVQSVEASWDSVTRTPWARVAVRDGRVNHKKTGFSAERLFATAVLDGTVVTADPVTAHVRGEDVVGSLRFDLAGKSGTASVSGTLTDIEGTALATAFKKTEVSGSASLTAKALRRADGTCSFDAKLDASQTGIGYSWWLRKPPGVGATGAIHGEFLPRKTLTLEADLRLVDSDINSEIELAHNGKRWTLRRTTSRAGHLDVDTVGQCVRLPYAVKGGTATDCRHIWIRDHEENLHWHIDMGARVDTLTCIPTGGQEPFVVDGATIDATMVGGATEEGTISLRAQSCSTPRFGETWFLPMRTDPELTAKYPPIDRTWTYALAADAIAVPPWRGADFKANGSGGPREVVLESYRADVDGGSLTGWYRRDRTTNLYESRAEWTNVPRHIPHRTPRTPRGPLRTGHGRSRLVPGQR